MIKDLTPEPAGIPAKNTTTIFSPRKSLTALEWYAERMDKVKQTIALTAAFGINPILAEVLGKDKDYLRYLLLERPGNNHDVYGADTDVQISIGSVLKENLYQWTKEKLTGFNVRVRYIHTKFLIIDPLTKDPIVISGSANFSKASTKNNDENMLIIRGNERVADIYLGEFMRLFNHFYFRYHAGRIKNSMNTAQKKHAFLFENPSWTNRYYKGNSIKTKQRKLFA